jgi:hypothetical protein
MVLSICKLIIGLNPHVRSRKCLFNWGAVKVLVSSAGYSGLHQFQDSRWKTKSEGACWKTDIPVPCHLQPLREFVPTIPWTTTLIGVTAYCHESLSSRFSLVRFPTYTPTREVEHTWKNGADKVYVVKTVMLIIIIYKLSLERSDEALVSPFASRRLHEVLTRGQCYRQKITVHRILFIHRKLDRIPGPTFPEWTNGAIMHSAAWSWKWSEALLSVTLAI